jgi:hypothetical protein
MRTYLLLLISLLLCGAVLSTYQLYGQERSVLDITGEDWIRSTQADKLDYITGYVTGYWFSSQVLLNNKVLSWEDYLKAVRGIDLLMVKIPTIISEIDDFYSETRAYDWPVWAVVILRNIWKEHGKDLPTWQEFWNTPTDGGKRYY